MFRRLDDHAIAGGQRRRKLVRQQRQRGIPGCDEVDHAVWFQGQIVERVRLVQGNMLTEELVRVAGEVTQLPPDPDHLRTRFPYDLAVVSAFDPRSEASFNIRAARFTPGVSRTPTVAKRPVCRCAGQSDILGTGVRDLCPYLARVRIGALQYATACGIHTVAVHIQLVSLYHPCLLIIRLPYERHMHIAAGNVPRHDPACAPSIWRWGERRLIQF